MVGDYSEREHQVEARKKSDSFSGARPVSTASLDSVRCDSISGRRKGVDRPPSIAEGVEAVHTDVPFEVHIYAIMCED